MGGDCHQEETMIHCDYTEHAGYLEMMKGNIFHRAGALQQDTPKLDYMKKYPEDMEVLFINGHDKAGNEILSLDDPFMGRFCEYIECHRWNEKEVNDMRESVIESLRDLPELNEREVTIGDRMNSEHIPKSRSLDSMYLKGAKYETHHDGLAVDEGWFWNPKENALVRLPMESPRRRMKDTRRRMTTTRGQRWWNPNSARVGRH